MPTAYVVYAGTVGQGVWRSKDGGETFVRASAGMFMEAEIRALAVHPHRPQTLYAGTDAGIYRTDDGGDRWERQDTPFDPGAGWQAGIVIWSLLIPPQQPETLFVGTCPPALYRSRDGGASWTRAEADFVPECGPIRYARVTCIVADPAEPDTFWAGVEIDGAWRSGDGGATWQRLGAGLSSQDIHALALVPAAPKTSLSETSLPKTILAATNNDLNISTDEGTTWQPQNVKAIFPHSYCRGLAQKADDPRTLFLGNGNGPPGTTGSLQISRNGGETWQAALLPTPPNSTVWTFATHPADPNLIFAATINGTLYRSEDGGATWRQGRHAFGEVRALAWVPA